MHHTANTSSVLYKNDIIFPALYFAVAFLSQMCIITGFFLAKHQNRALFTKNLGICVMRKSFWDYWAWSWRFTFLLDDETNDNDDKMVIIIWCIFADAALLNQGGSLMWVWGNIYVIDIITIFNITIMIINNIITILIITLFIMIITCKTTFVLVEDLFSK